MCFVDSSYCTHPSQTGEQGAMLSSNNLGWNFIMKKNVFSSGILSELSMSVGEAGGMCRNRGAASETGWHCKSSELC